MKYQWSQKMFGIRSAFLVTESHELHRIRRNALAHYFSKQSLRDLEPGVQSQVDKLVSRLQGLKGTGTAINLLDLYACLTGDIIGQYAFAKPYGFLDDPDFSPYWHQIMIEVSQNGHILKQFGWMLPLMQSMPEWMVKKTNPLMMTLINFQKVDNTFPLNSQLRALTGGPAVPTTSNRSKRIHRPRRKTHGPNHNFLRRPHQPQRPR